MAVKRLAALSCTLLLIAATSWAAGVGRYMAPVNPPPPPALIHITDVALSNTSVPRGSVSGTLIGTLSCTATGGTCSPTWSKSGVDQASFSISGNNVLAAATLNNASYTVTFTATDAGADNSPYSAPPSASYAGTITTVAQTLSSISPTTLAIDSGIAAGTTIAAVGVVLSPASPPYTGGTLSLTGADAGKFQLSSTTLPSNLQTNSGQPPIPDGVYSFNIVATNANYTGSPKTQAVTVTASSPGGDTLLTTRTITNTDPAGTAIAAGKVFRIGIPLKRGAVPAGQVLKIKDGAAATLNCQFDGRNTFPDGSAAYAEALCRSVSSISSTDTWNIYRQGTPASWPTTLPGGKTVAQLLIDVQSVIGAANLNFRFLNVQRLSGGSDTAATVGSGTWICSFNTLATGGGVPDGRRYVINQGSIALGLKVYGKAIDEGNPSQAHDHLRCEIQLWMHLNSSTGAIEDVEYMWWPKNGPLVANSLLQRYNFSWQVRDGTTVLDSGTMPHGAPAVNISSIVVSSGTATVTTAANHLLNSNDYVCFRDTLYTQLNGANTCAIPAAAAGILKKVTVTGAATFTIPVSTPDASVGAGGTVRGHGGLAAHLGLPLLNEDGRPKYWANGSMRPAYYEAAYTLAARQYAFGTGIVPSWQADAPITVPMQQTTLALPIDANDTTIRMTNKIGPCNNNGIYYIYVISAAGIENMQVANCSAVLTDLTVTRGFQDSTAVAHPAGAVVRYAQYTYQPGFKGPFRASLATQFLYNARWYDTFSAYTAGENWWLGPAPYTAVAAFYSPHYQQLDRVQAAYSASAVAWDFFDDATGLYPTFLPSSYSGLTNAGTGTYFQNGTAFAGTTQYEASASFDSVNFNMITGSGSSPVTGFTTTHQPHPAWVAYLHSGYTYLRDLAQKDATSASMWWVGALGSTAQNQRNKPGYPGGPIRYNALVGSGEAQRSDAWALASQVGATVTAPDAWADGSIYNARAYNKDSLQETVQFAADVINNQLTAPLRDTGYWNFNRDGAFQAWNITNGSCLNLRDHWMLGYFGMSLGIAQNAFHDDPDFGANVTLLARHIGNMYSSYYASGQSTWNFGTAASEIQGGIGPVLPNVVPCLSSALTPPNIYSYAPSWGSPGSAGLNMAIDASGWITPATVGYSNVASPGHSTTLAAPLASNAMQMTVTANAGTAVPAVTLHKLQKGEWVQRGTSCGGTCWNITRARNAPDGSPTTAQSHDAGDFVNWAGLPGLVSLGDKFVLPAADYTSVANPVPPEYTKNQIYCVRELDATRPNFAMRLGVCPSGSPIASATSVSSVRVLLVDQVANAVGRVAIPTDATWNFDTAKALAGMRSLMAAGITDADLVAFDADMEARLQAVPSFNWPAVNSVHQYNFAINP